MTAIPYLLFVHIAAGSIALLAATLAMVSSKGKKLHIQAGRAYFWGMLVIFITAIPMSIIKNIPFLFLIAVFSFYLAFAGRRFAQNRSGVPARVDWMAVVALLLAGLGMLLLSARYFATGDAQYLTLLVFGAFAVIFAGVNFARFKNQTATGKHRIAGHLGMMLGGTIAVVTAVLVVNVDIQPVWIPWLLPTAIGTPAIFWWRRKVLS